MLLRPPVRPLILFWTSGAGVLDHLSLSHTHTHTHTHIHTHKTHARAQTIRELLDIKRYVIVVEHDLSVLDYLSDFICCLYGKPGAYGVVTLPFSVREGINIFLAGGWAARVCVCGGVSRVLVWVCRCGCGYLCRPSQPEGKHKHARTHTHTHTHTHTRPRRLCADREPAVPRREPHVQGGGEQHQRGGGQEVQQLRVPGHGQDAGGWVGVVCVCGGGVFCGMCGVCRVWGLGVWGLQHGRGRPRSAVSEPSVVQTTQNMRGKGRAQTPAHTRAHARATPRGRRATSR